MYIFPGLCQRNDRLFCRRACRHASEVSCFYGSRIVNLRRRCML